MNRGEPSPDTIRAQLAEILASPPFAQANRSRRFLEYTVEQTLAGAHDSIKEIVLAAEVFDRRNDFDPRIDPIVRVEAGKLRARLQDYYNGAGRHAPVVIEIPKGGYVPRFSLRTDGAADAHVPLLGRRALMVTLAAAVIVALTGGGWWWLSPRGDAGRVPDEHPSIAVLPLLNLGADPRDEYLSDGLSEQLTGALTEIDGLRVVSRTSAFTFKGKPAVAAEVGRRLGVTKFLEGSVQRSGGRVRVTVQLIRTSDGYHVWSQTFDRDLTDVFRLQDDLAEAVARELKIVLADDARRKVFKRYTADPDAFDLYLRGRHALLDLRPDAPEQAIALFQRAIDRDGSFALAYFGIAAAANIRNMTGQLPSPAITAQIKAAAEKALQLDDTLAEAHALLGNVAAFDWNWSAADASLRHALKLNPRSPEIHLSYAQNVLLPLRRFEEAVAECDAALALDPLSFQIQYCRPWVHLFSGQAELAMREFQEMLAAEPHKVLFRAGIVNAAIRSGHDAEAVAILDAEPLDIDLLMKQTPASLMLQAYVDARVGRRARALEIQRRLEEASRAGAISKGLLTLVYLGTGQLQDARDAAISSIRDHDPNIRYFTLDPLYAPLLADPEIAALLKAAGLR